MTRCTWRDSAILADGACARVAAVHFDELWDHGVGLTLRPNPRAKRATPPPLEDVGDVPVRVITDLRRNRLTEQALLRVFRAAREEILLTNQYCLPTAAVMRELVHAVRRGVAVRLIVPRLARPLIAGLATEQYLGRALAAGIQVWRWNGPMIHAKTVVVDRAWSMIGSSNLDVQSLRVNAELNVEVHGTAVAGQMVEIFNNDLRNSTPYARDEWHGRPRLWQSLTWLAALARPVL